ncbi:hypothetical protein DXB21_16190 [Bacteroides faecis]|nr:hypothetical protein DXB21_16190 [Bacteroides faecis]RGU15710.1 hypothetical protein DWW93_10600 [Bacteroides faecis]
MRAKQLSNYYGGVLSYQCNDQTRNRLSAKLLLFISVFPYYSEKNIYLCHTLSAHQRDVKRQKVVLLLISE